MKKRVRLTMLTGICIGMLLTACASKPAPVQPVQPATEAAPTADASEEATRPPKGNKPELVIALPKDISGLNPMTSSNTINDNCLALTHETLFQKRDDGTIASFIATEGVWTDDVTYELMLRQDVTFSDGSKMTAADVAHTIETAKGLANAELKALLEGIEEVEAVADNRVRFKTSAGIEDIEERLSNVALSVQSKAAYETGMQNPYLIGTGRYKFTDRVNGRYTTFALNELYWGTAPGVSKRISFYAIPDEEARASALLTGTADVALFDSAQITERFQDETSVRVYEAGFSEYRIAYRENAVIPAFYESVPMPWAESYVVLE